MTLRMKNTFSHVNHKIGEGKITCINFIFQVHLVHVRGINVPVVHIGRVRRGPLWPLHGPLGTGH